ncbi:hypothetical protein SARC_04898 [Sphaeroforma arctica JP610]|uniref:Uncharacterized protein n=1 Tax=Sphaeroforma arctica JP610 TaxID=667725 RepID=A0A0L0G126_9EUKA|nr:hypothetical protein SARC_04898 [Sphaeroforma arctica JP610]KNC82832.1 hypothetical protein SARC_04898 [Sphaeroforma arctica JP610]|eukprot:XP_014156734.1 hypothetical protein SARC_04898 [Sphaeroforma arctica JP610]
MLVSGIKHCARFAAHLPQNVVMGRSMSTTLQYTSTRTRTLYKTPAAKANYLKLYTRDAPLWSGRALISTTRTQMMSNQDDKDVAQTAADKRNMGDARTLIQKSLAYSDRGDYVKALNELDAALENVVHLSPELPLISEIRKMMGLLLWDLDEFELCREQLEMYFNVSDKPGPIDWDKVKLAETPQHELTAIAQCYAELALKVIREVYPDEDYNLQAASVLQALASTYEHFNQNAIYTEGFYKNALSIFEHPDSVEDLFDNEDHSMQYLSCLKDFAGFMRSRGRIGDAEEAERKHKKHNEMYREHVRSRNLREQAEKLQQQQDIEAAKKHADKIRAMHDAKDEILADKQTQGK